VQIPLSAKRGRDKKLFGGTCLLIVSLLGCAAAGLFPRLLPSLDGNAANDLTIYNTASSPHGMLVALIVLLVGMVGAIFYVTTVYRIWNGKVKDAHY
jgi:cytochrome bd-type quinol oxidase subunit 2